MYNEEKPKKKRFKLFDTQREGKGVSKEDANLPPRLKKFFILYRRDFGRLLSVNILMVLGNFPLLFLIVALSGVLNIEFATHASQSYTAFAGIFADQGMSAPLLALGGIIGAPTLGTIYTTPAYIFMGIGALSIFTFGLVNVGTTYLLRNMVMGDLVRNSPQPKARAFIRHPGCSLDRAYSDERDDLKPRRRILERCPLLA